MSISDSVADPALVDAARGGDARAFELLLARHESSVLRLLRLLGVAPRDREDVAQEVFVRMFRHLGSFRRGRFEGWLYRIAVNATHDHRRRATRRGRREAPWNEEFEPRALEADDPARILERSDRRLRLEGALECLSDRERAVFVLCEMEGQETRIVARALGISSITVRRHLGRARARLQRALAEIE